MSNQPRRRFGAEEKVKILRLHLLEGKAAWDLCQEHGIQPSLFYSWQQQFFQNGTRALEGGAVDRTQNRLEKQIEQLEARLARKHEVLCELMEEHIRLKKELGEG